jgi:predicted AlkP superfamily pyrophosphatase or phosphodiesterase
MSKLLLIVIDGVPYRNFRTLFGNLEGWVKSNDALVLKSSAPLPSISASCYASIHTGLDPQEHGCTGNNDVRRLNVPDIFSELRNAGRTTGAVTHSFWSEFFNRAPFDAVRDIEYDEPESASINHGRFHTMSGYGRFNAMTPSDFDLFATLTRLTEQYEIDYGIYHSCTLDSIGHAYHHDCQEMELACCILDGQLARFIRRWRNSGYEIIVTADHGQNERGHHGGRGEDQQDTALYYFGDAELSGENEHVQVTQIAPTVLSLMGVPIPSSMPGEPFLQRLDK